MTVERKLHQRHYSAFRVEKEKPAKYGGKRSKKPWIVHYPTDPCSDYQPRERFATHGEAINRAGRLAFRQALIWQFEEYLDNNQNVTVSPDYDHTGLDTMYRTFKWWGTFDLPGFLENI